MFVHLLLLSRPFLGLLSLRSLVVLCFLVDHGEGVGEGCGIAVALGDGTALTLDSGEVEGEVLESNYVCFHLRGKSALPVVPVFSDVLILLPRALSPGRLQLSCKLVESSNHLRQSLPTLIRLFRLDEAEKGP